MHHEIHHALVFYLGLLLIPRCHILKAVLLSSIFSKLGFSCKLSYDDLSREHQFDLQTALILGRMVRFRNGLSSKGVLLLLNSMIGLCGRGFLGPRAVSECRSDVM